MIKDKYHSRPNLRFPVCYIKQPLITLCCCFWRNQGGARSLSPQLHAFYTLLSTSKASVLKLLLSLAFLRARVELTFQVLLDRGMYLRNFRSSFLVKQLSMCLKNREEPGVGLLSACFVVCGNLLDIFCSTKSHMS